MNITSFIVNFNFIGLALLQDMKLHEESRLAVCLQFHSFSGMPNMWVVYCVQQLEMLAELYTTLRHAATTRNSSMYVSISVRNSLYERIHVHLLVVA